MFDVALSAGQLEGVWEYPDDPSGLSNGQVESGFSDLHRMWQSIGAKRLAYLAELERRASYRRDGYLSGAAWLADRFGLGAGAAKQEVRVATAVPGMPMLNEAMAAGQVNGSAVPVL